MDPDLIKDLIPMALTQLVAFLIFIWLLKRFAVGPVTQLLDERREKIVAKFDEIEATEKRVAALKEEYETHLREIDEEARKKVHEEVTRGKRIAEEIVENARTEASQAMEKTKLNTQIQIDQARAEIKDEVIAMTLGATELLIKELLDEAKHRQLVGSFIEELEKRN